MALFNILKNKPDTLMQKNALEALNAHLAEKLQQVKLFWDEFTKEKERLLTLDPRQTVEQSNEILDKYFKGVVAEFEQDKDGKFSRFIISANGIVQHFNDVMMITQNTPQFSDLTIVAFRQRVTNSTKFSISMNDFTLNTEDVLLKLTPFKGRIDVKIAWGKEIEPAMLEHAKHMSLLMQDHVLGEYDSVVKVAEISFDDQSVSPNDRKKWIPLPDVPHALDHMWKEDLGHTQAFPTEGVSDWLAFELNNENDEDDVMIGMINDSAHSLVCRADMGARLDICVNITDKEVLDHVYDYEDALRAKMAPLQLGLHVLTLFPLKEKRRTLTYYVSDEQLGLQAAVDAAKRFPELEMTFDTEYDPRWDGYLTWSRDYQKPAP